MKSNIDEHIENPIRSINKIDSIIFFDDFEDLERFNPGDMTASDLTPDQNEHISGIKITLLDNSTGIHLTTGCLFR